MINKDSKEYFSKGTVIALLSTFGLPFIGFLIWIGSSLKGWEDHQRAQDTINARQERFNARQLQYDELFKAEFYHIGHILGKMDTTGSISLSHKKYR